MKNNSLNLYFHASTYEIYSLAASVVIFIISLVFSRIVILRYVLQIIASVLCLLPYIPDIISNIENKKYLNYRFILTLSFVLIFVSGFSSEATAMVIVYSVYSKLLYFAKYKTDEQFAERVADLGESDRDAVQAKKQAQNSISKSILSAASKLPYFVIALAALYLILVPLIFNISFRTAVHRASVILLLYPCTAFFRNILYTEKFTDSRLISDGFHLQSLDSIDKITQTDKVVIDYPVFLDYGNENLLKVESPVFERNTFIAFIAHCVYNSENFSMREPILKLNRADIQPDIIKDFKEYDGIGVGLSISNAITLFGRRELMEYFGMDADITPSDPEDTLYLNVAGRYAGKLVPGFTLNNEIYNLTDSFRAAGYSFTCLISELDNDEVNDFAENHNFDLSYGNCNLSTKINTVKKLSSEKGNTLYLFRDGFDKHSDATADMKVGERAGKADAAVSEDSIEKIGSLKKTGTVFRNSQYISTAIMLAAKAACIFLAMSGLCTAWFAVIADISFEILSLLFVSYYLSE